MSLDVDIRVRRGGFLLDARFRIERPGVTALFGASGAGKTTVTDAIAGLVRPDEGAISVNGRAVFDSHTGIDLSAHARRVGYVFQEARLFPHMTVENNLLFGWRRAANRLGAAERDAIVTMLGIAHLRGRAPRTLSGGEKQRIAIGRALMASPDILLLDEPMAALDLARRDEILPYLERLRDDRRLPILYVSHAVDEVARLADEVVVLERGRVLDCGSVFELMPRIDPRAGTVLEAVVARHREDGLTELDIGERSLVVQRVSVAIGGRLRVRIAAPDIMISLHALRDVSANNVIAAKAAAIEARGPEIVDVWLAAGTAKLVARITAASARRLDLEQGRPVFAVIKAVTVEPAANPPTGRAD